jgi:hypothetical protein
MRAISRSTSFHDAFLLNEASADQGVEIAEFVLKRFDQRLVSLSCGDFRVLDFGQFLAVAHGCSSLHGRAPRSEK